MGNAAFGRLVEFDERSRNYSIRSLIATGTKPRSYTWRCNSYLDQGDQPECVGFAWTHEAIARPVEIKNIGSSDARLLYKLSQTLDDYPGENYEGTSIIGGAKAQQQMKRLAEYRWCFSESDLLLTVGYKGPVVLGINWYSGMEKPDSNGVIKPTGFIAGGHAILCIGVSIKTNLYRLHNSWGQSWGVNGDCYISREDMTRLLKEDGEACIPVQRLKG